MLGKAGQSGAKQGEEGQSRVKQGGAGRSKAEWGEEREKHSEAERS